MSTILSVQTLAWVTDIILRHSLNVCREQYLIAMKQKMLFNFKLKMYLSISQESTATSEPGWGGKRLSAAGRKASVTSRKCLTS